VLQRYGQAVLCAVGRANDIDCPSDHCILHWHGGRHVGRDQQVQAMGSGQHRRDASYQKSGSADYCPTTGEKLQNNTKLVCICVFFLLLQLSLCLDEHPFRSSKCSERAAAAAKAEKPGKNRGVASTVHISATRVIICLPGFRHNYFLSRLMNIFVIPFLQVWNISATLLRGRTARRVLL